MLNNLNDLYKPWGLLGILFAVGSILLGCFAVYIGKRIKNEKTLNNIILLFGISFFIMEVVHEVRRYYELGGYDWSSFPFQISSVSMYLCFILQFIKRGRAREAILSFMSLFTTLSGFLPIFFAQGNLFRWETLQGVMFSFIWHILLALLGLIVLSYKDMGKNFKNDKYRIIEAFSIFIIITCIAQILNLGIHTFAKPFPIPEIGYKEVGYIPKYELDPDSASLFYISPFFKSNIGIGLSTIWLKLGFLAAWGAYSFSFITLASLVYLISFSIKRALAYLINRYYRLFKCYKNVR